MHIKSKKSMVKEKTQQSIGEKKCLKKILGIYFVLVLLIVVVVRLEKEWRKQKLIEIVSKGSHSKSNIPMEETLKAWEELAKLGWLSEDKDMSLQDMLVHITLNHSLRIRICMSLIFLIVFVVWFGKSKLNIKPNQNRAKP